MILHLIPAEKFTTDYINRINKLFDFNKHYFVVYGANKKEYRLNEIDNMECVRITFSLCAVRKELTKLVEQSERIIFHSLFLKLIDLFLLNNLISRYNKSIAWNIWGKDLYEDYEKSKGLKAVLYIKPVVKEFLRKSLIGKMDIFITTGDYEALKERYKTKNGAVRLSAQYSYKFIKFEENTHHNGLNVMVGHSATETCRHIDTFRILERFVGKIRVYCPLSYPNDQEYIQIVCKDGRRIFGKDFFPMTDFLTYEEYVKFLNTIDIGVFNNNRQQGMGNITNLLFLGKKVYLSSDNTIRKSYSKNEYRIFDCEEIDETFLKLLSKEEALHNKDRIEYKFYDENFYNEWRQVFEWTN